MMLLAFLAPIGTVGAAIGFLLFIDIATGIWASFKEGKAVTSDRFGRSVTKSLVYLIALVVSHVAELYVFEGSIPIVKVVAGLIAGSELISIGENLTRVSGLNFRSLFKRILPEQLDKVDRGTENRDGSPKDPRP